MRKIFRQHKKIGYVVECFITVVVYLAILVAVYCLIYFLFKGNVYGGAVKGSLQKNDWLSFTGSYLSFSGTVLFSGLVLWQTHHYATLREHEQTEHEKELNRKRLREIQPIFSVKIKSKNTPFDGVAAIFDSSNLSALPEHQKFTLEIENVGSYPIKHVIIFNSYLYQLLRSNEKVTIQCAYGDSIDAQNINETLVEIDNEIERDKSGLATWFNIHYEDIDGNSMYQSFALNFFQYYNNSPKTYYYELTEIEKTSENKKEIT